MRYAPDGLPICDLGDDPWEDALAFAAYGGGYLVVPSMVTDADT